MAERTTRNKIRWQTKKILDKIEDIYEHLRYIDDLGGRQSEIINANLPELVQLTESFERVIRSFRDLL